MLLFRIKTARFLHMHRALRCPDSDNNSGDYCNERNKEVMLLFRLKTTHLLHIHRAFRCPGSPISGS